MKRSGINSGAKSLARGSTFAAEPIPLNRTAAPRRPRAISPASLPQRRKIAFEVCIVCQADHCDPAHLIDRSLGGDDDPRAVVALCRQHHREYDDGSLSLLEYLEPHYRAELAYAVELVGLITALERITNERWRAVA